MKDKIFYQNPFTQYFYVGSDVKEIFSASLQEPLLSNCMAQQSSKLVCSRKALWENMSCVLSNSIKKIVF